MNINPINNQQNTNNSFGKLRKISCPEGLCNSSERRVRLELKDMAEKNNFFKDNNVDAFIKIQRNIALLNLKYKPIGKTFIEKFKNLFVHPEELVIVKYHLCPDEGMFFLVKEMRKAKNSEDLMSIAKKR